MIEKPEKSFLCIYCKKEHDFDSEICPETDKLLTPIHKLSGTELEGKYKIHEIIGEGGMGVIYESEHMAIGKKLAIKFLNPELRQSIEAYERFKREARASAIIAHKNIVDVIDIGETIEGIPYIIMEFLSGQDLGRRITDWRRIPLDESRNVLIQVLEALAAVHSCGVVHRDLKPENVFLARQSGGSEIVKVLDFGISRLTRGEDRGKLRLTKAGYVYGTPNYIAPEQAEGKADIDHRSDLYSAGMILYEMVTGQLPFTGESYGKLLVDIITKPIPDPRNFFPDLPISIVSFLNLSLEKNPNERFQSAQEMLREMKSIDIEYTSHPSSPPSDRKRTPSRPGRKRTTPIKELSEKKHRDFMTPKRESSSSSYKIVSSKRSLTSPEIFTPPPVSGSKMMRPPSVAEINSRPPSVAGTKTATPGEARTTKRPTPRRSTPVEAGSYRIVSASSERIYEPGDAKDKKEEKKKLERENTSPASLPATQKSVVKKNQKKHQ